MSYAWIYWFIVLLLSHLEVLCFVDLLGSIQAVELDWGNEDHIKAVAPPFDYIIGTDVVSSPGCLHFAQSPQFFHDLHNISVFCLIVNLLKEF